MITAPLANAAAETAPTTTPQISAPRIAGNLVLDGVPDEPVWQQAGRIDDLSQQSPHPGGPTPYHTRVLLLRDSYLLYVAIVAEDPDPSRVATHTLVRDADQSNDDGVTLVFDTFGTRRVAYVFQVNAAGAMADGLIAPTPDVSFSNGVDYNWDGIWQAVVRRNPGGWTAELAIDTRSLQFASGGADWGFNVSRYVPRDLLTLAWSGISLDSSVLNPNREGSLTGLQGMEQGKGFDFQPYGIARQQTDSGDTSKAGFDLKYDFDPSLAGLLTYHTDFAEADADQQQINTGRFPLFFPEKRQFFQQGSNLFSFGDNMGTNLIPFYSRQIGLVDGEQVPLDEGVKLIGQSEQGSLALLDTQMGGSAVSNASNLFAGRGTYNLDPNLQLGAIATHGTPTGSGDNTFIGADAVWKTSTFDGDKNLHLFAWAVHSGGDVPAGSPNGYGAGFLYPNDLWYAYWQSYNFGDGLDPGLGFLPRSGIRRNFAEVTYKPRPASDGAFGWVSQFFIDGSFVNYDGYGPNDGGKQTLMWDFAPSLTTLGGWNWNSQYIYNFDAPPQPFTVANGVTIPAGRYTWRQRQFGFTSPRSQSLVVSLTDTWGAYYSGTQQHPFLQVNWNLPSGDLQLNATHELFFGYLPQGDFVTRLSTLGGTYSFTPDLYVSALAQYSNEVPGVSFNLRLRWIVDQASNIYVVWNRGLVTENTGLGQPIVSQGNEVILKIQWDLRN
ncbi:MAG TPA: DUF5916 domain-containing protein [Gammaproteobacteria bacterium]|nr:DUF5916 domain-containing protein [Gammaproteobacteria bacterium]